MNFNIIDNLLFFKKYLKFSQNFSNIVNFTELNQ